MLVITPGDPAGIGPDCLLLAAQEPFPTQSVVVASLSLLRQRAKEHGLRPTFIPYQPGISIKPEANVIHLLDVPLSVPVITGRGDPANAPYIRQTLDIALQLCLSDPTHHALVTGPVHKALMNEGGVIFSGHTEYLQQATASPWVQMVFMLEGLTVGLMTTHIPLRQVPDTLTPDFLERQIRQFNLGLKRYLGLQNPHIAVLGLNPHAGEQGLLGFEEKERFIPVLVRLQQENMSLTGPIPADTAFTPSIRTQYDGILAVYHDQALAPLKALGFGEAVNVTFGLPFIRTSVDHGTAFDKAGTPAIQNSSFKAALQRAHQLCHLKH